MDLRGTYPINTYKNLLNTDNINMYDGTGSAITFLNITASDSLSASYEVFAEYFATHSEFSVSSSWASASLRSDFSTTSSWASRSLRADGADIASFSYFAETASWASQSLSANSSSWASASYTSSFLPTGTYRITSSWSITSSIVSNLQSYVKPEADTVVVVAGGAPSFIFGTEGSTINLSQLPISGSSVTASLFGTASWAQFAVAGGTTLNTGSTYPITSSWSEHAVSASYISGSISFANTAYDITASHVSFSGKIDNYFPMWSGNTLTPTSSIYFTESAVVPPITNYYNLGSPTLQWKSAYLSTSSLYLGHVPISVSGSTLIVSGSAVTTAASLSGSLLPVTASRAVSSSYSQNASSATSASRAVSANAVTIGTAAVNGPYYVLVASGISGELNVKADSNFTFDPNTDIMTIRQLSASGVTASLVGTASWATNASTLVGTASWATNASTLVGTASWAQKSLTASYFSGSVLFVGNSDGYFPQWLNNVLTPTSSIRFISSSVYVDSGGGTLFSNITGSVSAVTINSTEVIATTLTATGSLNGSLEGTASWANSANSASLSQLSRTASAANTIALIDDQNDVNYNVVFVGAGFYKAPLMDDGAFTYNALTNILSVPVVSSENITASAGIVASLEGTASWATNAVYATLLETGSTYEVTSSWAVTASYAETSVGYTGDIMFLDGNTTTSHTMSFVNGILKTYTTV